MLSPIKSFIKNRSLIIDLAKREVSSRYKGSAAGLLWSFFNPLLMLAVYTFVFSVIFQSRWAGGSGSKTEFALVLFSGLIVFNLFSEVINKAPVLIIGNINYVKKIIFPLEILPYVALVSSIFQLFASIVVWLVFYVVFFGIPPITILLLPIALIPLILLILGSSWILASLGVYIRDTPQFVAIGITIMMFLSPIFYSASSIPIEYRQILQFNPLTFSIETARNLMIWGGSINWMNWMRQAIFSVAVFWVGYTWFQKTKGGFADVL
jgi:lipopolysaccharide transport system permease protein